MSMLVWSCIVAVAVLLGQQNSPTDPLFGPDTRDNSNSLVVVYVLLGVFSFMYLWETMYSSTLQYIMAYSTVAGVEQYAQAMYAVVPRLVIWVNCYHWSYYHSYDYGRGYSSSTTQQHRVYTHRVVVPVPLATYRARHHQAALRQVRRFC